MKLIPRPQCPQGHPGRVWLAGTYGKWSPYYERARFTCVPAGSLKRHRFTYTERMRHPTHRHPRGGSQCPHCEHAYSYGEGPGTGSDFTFTFQEVAKTLLELGAGESYRESSARGRKEAKRFTLGVDDPSREAALAMQYVDVFADILIDQYAPTQWPAAVAVDLLPLKKRRFKSATGTWESENYGAVIVAMDHSGQGKGRCLLLHLAGGKDTQSFVEFFKLLPGAPEWVVADAELGLDKAMSLVPGWEQTVLYRCEGHLWKNAVDAAAEDGIAKYVKRPASEFRDQPERKSLAACTRHNASHVSMRLPCMSPALLRTRWDGQDIRAPGVRSQSFTRSLRCSMGPSGRSHQTLPPTRTVDWMRGDSARR